MIKEASKIDEKNHDNIDKVLNLLKNADYQLQLAEEMGYGKKDKEFAELSLAIESLKKSIDKKQNSKSKFDSLKKQIKEFKERLFTNKS
jgi:molybdenum cofactor biosynthesis enzyme MoaA